MYEDKMFGVPIDAQSEVVLYNKKILAKYSAALPTNRSERRKFLYRLLFYHGYYAERRAFV